MAAKPWGGTPIGTGRREKYARYLEMALGVWLALSAFLWPHAAVGFWNTLIVGVAVAAVAALGLFAWWGRFLNTAVSIWLVVSALSFVHEVPFTRWHNAVLGLCVFVLSIVPTRVEMTAGGRWGLLRS